MLRIHGSTQLLSVVGDPIAHSLSPIMHNTAIQALGLDAVYVPFRASPSALTHVLRGFQATGVAGNLTVPHKVAAANLIIRLSERAKELEAVNTFWTEGDRLAGDNTDLPGLLDVLDQAQAESPWLLLGTGGSARAAVLAARQHGVKVLIRSRDPARARDFVQWSQKRNADVLIDDGRQVGTVINTTPLGLHKDDALPVAFNRVEGAKVAIDLVYARGGTQWVRACREREMRAMDGRGLLVAQGAHAFERFFDGYEAPREIMAAAVEQALRP